MMTKARLAGVSGGSIFQRVVFWIVQRALGQVPQPLQIAALNAKIFGGHVRMERAQQGARTVPVRLKFLAQARVASLTGCPF
jgi:hypothetical protein